MGAVFFVFFWRSVQSTPGDLLCHCLWWVCYGGYALWIDPAYWQRDLIFDIEHRIDKVNMVIIAEGVSGDISLLDAAGVEQLLSFCTIEKKSARGIETVTFA